MRQSPAGAELPGGEPQPGPGAHLQRLHRSRQALPAAVHRRALSSLHGGGPQTRHKVRIVLRVERLTLSVFQSLPEHLQHGSLSETPPEAGRHCCRDWSWRRRRRSKHS